MSFVLHVFWLLCVPAALGVLQSGTQPPRAASLAMWSSSSARIQARAVPAGRAASIVGGLERSRALVIALHGGSWVDPDPQHLAERCRDALSDAARRAGLRLVVPVSRAAAPDADYEVPWLTPDGEALVLATLEDELRHHSTDRSRVYLAGHGAGATGALLLAARHASRIAGVAAWAGTPSPLWDHDHRVVGLVDNPVAGLVDMPVFLWTARDDPYLDRVALRLLVDGLRSERMRPESARFLWVDDDSGGHGFGPGGPAAGMQFLKACRRPQPP